MKKFFSNIIDKVKSFIESMTPTAKIRYVVISVVTIAIAVSLLVAVSLSKSEPETPTNPKDFGTGNTVSIDFDTEIIFEISGESSSVSTTDDITYDTSITTNVASGTDEPTSGEESSNVETDNNTEVTDESEPQPTDPSQDYNPDPLPEDTKDAPVVNPNPTETTTQTQTTPKPTETTTTAPQTEPKPTETTTAPQTQPKPTETTTKTPQTEPKPTETTKPQESEPQPAGQFSLKEKKYDYNGANVTILQVENKSEQAYTIKITGKFKDANGNIVKTESKTFEGFPAGWSNYFVFQPGVKYSSVSWDMKADVFTGEPVAKYFYPGDRVDIQITWGLVDRVTGQYLIPTSPEEAAAGIKQVCLNFIINGMTTSYHSPINFTGDVVIFDNAGKLYYITAAGTNNIMTDETFSDNGTPMPTGVDWEDKDNYSLPTNLNGVSGFYAVTSVTQY